MDIHWSAYNCTYPVAPVACVVAVCLAIEVVHGVLAVVPTQKQCFEVILEEIMGWVGTKERMRVNNISDRLWRGRPRVAGRWDEWSVSSRKGRCSGRHHVRT